MPGSAILHVIFNILLLILSIVIIVVTALVLPSESIKGKTISYVETGSSTSGLWKIWDISPGTKYASLKATLAAGCIGLATGMLAIASALSGEGKRRLLSRLGAAPSAATLITAIVAFVWSFVATYMSHSVYKGPFNSGLAHGIIGNYYESYSAESWTCQTAPLRFPVERGDVERLCGLAQSSRWLTLPFLIINIELMFLWVRELLQQAPKKNSKEVELERVNGH